MPETKQNTAGQPGAPETPKFPTEIVDLPSKGLLYPEGHPLSGGTVELKYMTAREEDILSSANLIRKGVVIDELLKSLVVSDVNFNDILVGDKNAIMVNARIFGYGKQYKSDVTCPKCGAVEKDCEFDLTSIGYKEIDDKVYNRKNEFEYELPNSQRKIVFKMLNQGDEVAITKDIEAVSKHVNNVTPEITTRLRYQIISVDGNKDKSFINNFIQNEFFAVDSRAYREHYASIQPDVDLDFMHSCPSCGEQSIADVPISVNFFWPSQ